MEKTTKSIENNNNTVSNAGKIQRQISIGVVNDPMEHEANAVADKLMCIPEMDFFMK